MAVADFTTLKAKLASPTQRIPISRTWVSPPSPGLGSMWLGTGGTPAAGSTPGASAICDRTTVGALGQLNPGGSEHRLWLPRIAIGAAGQGPFLGTLVVCDRLVHMGGLDSTVTTPQTVSTSALTRSTSGAGVMAAFEVYTALGASATTATISYTNQAGTSGITSPVFDIPGATFCRQSRLLPIPLAAGDTGIKAVASITLAGSTGTAGNFGITLYRELMRVTLNLSESAYGRSYHPVEQLGFMAPVVDTDACIFFAMTGNGQITNSLIGEVLFFED